MTTDTAETRPRKRSFYRRHRRVVWCAVTVATLATVGIGAAGAFVLSTISSAGAALDDLGELPQYAGRPTADADGAVNLLLLGSDTRETLDTDELVESGPQRADTIMLLHVAADRRSVQVMSIPRDTWVEVPGHGPAKVNAALAWGGVALEVQTVEGLVGARIDHVAVVDFAGVESIVSSLGAVTVENEVAFSRDDRRFERGRITLDGHDALEFVRERYAFADGDFQRVRNQQALLAGIGDRLLSTATLTDPLRVASFVDTTAHHVGVDTTWTTSDMIGLGVSLSRLRSSDVSFFTMPVVGTDTSADGQSIVLTDEPTIDRVRRAIAADDLASLSRPAG